MTSAAPLIELLRACPALLEGATNLDRFTKHAHQMLRAFTPQEILGMTLGPTGQALHDSTTGYLHLGFLAPFKCRLEGARESARKAGFDQRPLSFPSEVMSRELALLAALENVPTHILKVFAAEETGQKNGVEAFFPEVSEDQLEEWVRQGVGTHLGIGLHERDQVWRAVELCRRAGFHPPEFLGGEPAVNRTEDILVVYADGVLEGLPIRLELYHTASERLSS